jgi:hypothetical protein
MSGLLDTFVVPQVWKDNLPFTITEKAKLFQTPAVITDTNASFKAGGVFEHRPFMLQPVDKHLEKPQATTPLTRIEIAQDKDTMICIQRQADFTFSAAAVRRADPDWGNKLYNQIADWLAVEYELHAYGILKAIYGPGGTLYNSHTVETNSLMDFDTIFEAKDKLGDVDDDLTLGVYHSKIISGLRKKGLISDMFIWKAEQIVNGSMPRIAGMPALKNDLLKPITVNNTQKYLTFLLSPECIYFANPFLELKTSEVPYKNGGDQHLTIATDYCIHVPGVSYVLADKEPTDEQLYTPSTWQKVADHNKHIKLVALLTPATAPMP